MLTPGLLIESNRPQRAQLAVLDSIVTDALVRTCHQKLFINNLGFRERNVFCSAFLRHDFSR